MVSIVGYHTCKTDGGWSYIRSEAPFISGNGPGQWLSQGYYFWTDSSYFAIQWGERNKKYGGKFAIVKCKIDLDDDGFLDLVGSVEDQLYFRKLLSRHRDRMKVALERNGKSLESLATLTVSDVIRHLRVMESRGKGHFPFVAIKAQDDPEGKACFYVKSRKESMPMVTRQQVCLFEFGHASIVKRETVHPDCNDEEFYQGYNQS